MSAASSERLRVAVAGAGDPPDQRVVTVSFASEAGLAISLPLSRLGALRLAESLRKAAGPALHIPELVPRLNGHA